MYLFNYSFLQSKSLIGDSSVLFSPPSIIRDTLPDENHPLASTSLLGNKSPKKVNMILEFLRVVDS